MLFWLLRHGWLILPSVFVFPLPDGPHKKFWLLIELLGLIIIIIIDLVVADDRKSSGLIMR